MFGRVMLFLIAHLKSFMQVRCGSDDLVAGKCSGDAVCRERGDNDVG